MHGELLAAIGERIEASYLFKDRIGEIRAHLDRRHAGGAYDDLSGDGLAAALTEDLREVSGDLHFKLIYRSERLADRSTSDAETPEEIAAFRRAARFSNFGCAEVSRRPGNVGYWRISEFVDLIDGAGPTYVAAMRMLSSASALIVDVRGNSGGDPATVALACSFFFDVEPVHLNTFESAQGREQHQWWTLPHLDVDRYLDKPVLVLIDRKTHSAAEEFAYDLKHLGRAQIVGERTAGAAHLREQYWIDPHHLLNVPIARSVNPKTGTNWEGEGVEPDLAANAAAALETAYRSALRAIAMDDSLSEEERAEVGHAMAAGDVA